MPTPRVPAEIQGSSGEEVLAGAARVVNKLGEDVTEYYLRGAQQAAELVRRESLQLALLKARSPACGVGLIYDGSFSGRLKPGYGVAAARLRELGVKIFCEEELDRLFAEAN